MKKILYTLLLLPLLALTGCYDDSFLRSELASVKEQIAQLSSRVEQINADIRSLQTLYQAMAANVFVAAVENSDEGTTIRFSDGSTSFIRNGRDGQDGLTPVISVGLFEGRYYWQLTVGEETQWLTDNEGRKMPVTAQPVTPLLGIDAEGFWTVSYDEGLTYSPLLDANGERISILGTPGADGKDGKDGADGKDGVTPMVKIDEWGYWMVSYDNGVTFGYILTADGDKISAFGIEGEPGENGLSVRVTVNGDGFYCFEIYSAADPDTTLRTITTPLSANPSCTIRSIVEDYTTGEIVLTMNDGTVFRFNQALPYPTGIVALTRKVVLASGGTSTFEVVVNPSDALVNLSTSSSAASFVLNKVAKSRASYVVSPDNFEISKIEPATNDSGERLDGKFRITIADRGRERVYSEDFTLVLRTRNARGETVEISSDLISVDCSPSTLFAEFSVGEFSATIDSRFVNLRVPYGTDVRSLVPTFKTSSSGAVVKVDGREQHSGVDFQDFSMPVVYSVTTPDGNVSEVTAFVSYSDLPVVFVKTPAEVADKEHWVAASTISVLNAGQASKVYEEASVRGRGNSTWSQPKKPYAIKLSAKSEVLSMPKHKRWVLLANYFDRTALRNAMAFAIGQRAEGLAWTPRGQFVDVVMNGTFLGNYYLCEQIKIDKNRLDITEMKASDSSDADITGGYLLEMDTNFDEANRFRTLYRGLPVNIKSPEEDVLTERQLGYIKGYLDTVEARLYDPAAAGYGEYQELLDLENFADWYLVVSLTQCWEPNHPKSCYFYKDRGGRLCMGPIWDFDWGTFSRTDGWKIPSALYFDRLLADAAFVSTLKSRWRLLRPRLTEVVPEIDALAKAIKPSVEYNNSIWSAGDVNGDEAMTFNAALERLKIRFTNQMFWMDGRISEM